MLERLADRVQAVLLLAMAGLGLWAWQQVPTGTQVPIHFDLQGMPNGWASPGAGLLGLPALATAMWGLRALLAKIDLGPAAADRARQAALLDIIFVAANALLACCQVLIVVVSLTAWRPAASSMLLPIGLFLAVVALAVFKLLDPRSPQLARSGPAVGTIRRASLGLTAAVFGIMVAATFSAEHLQHRLLLLVMGVFLVVTGNLMGKLRPNALLGIRTPWTLANERVWDQTHRFGGKAQVLAGAVLLGLAATPLPSAWQGPAVALVVLAASGAAVLKSYLLWRALPPPPADPGHA